jgi:hypothetical protein
MNVHCTRGWCAVRARHGTNIKVDYYNVCQSHGGAFFSVGCLSHNKTHVVLGHPLIGGISGRLPHELGLVQ